MTTREHDWEVMNCCGMTDLKGEYDLLRCRACYCRAVRRGTVVRREKLYSAIEWESCAGKPTPKDRNRNETASEAK